MPCKKFAALSKSEAFLVISTTALPFRIPKNPLVGSSIILISDCSFVKPSSL